jgi:hypothetical protein
VRGRAVPPLTPTLPPVYCAGVSEHQRGMRFHCHPGGATKTSTAGRVSRAFGGGGPRRSADGSYVERGSAARRSSRSTRSSRAKKPSEQSPLPFVECEDEIEEEIARAFAEGLGLGAAAAGGSAAAAAAPATPGSRAAPAKALVGKSPPTTPVTDPSESSPPVICGDPAEIKGRTLFILDWDDTLLTTTRLTSSYGVLGPAAATPLPDKLVRGLQLLEHDVNQLIDAVCERGRVVVVTNAAKGWVQQSGRRFIPGVVKHITEVGIQVVSAQEAFARSCPSGDPTDWKKKAFLREVSSGACKPADLNFISVGDSIFERAASHYVSKRKGIGITKTVKFIDMPTIDQLRRQLTMLTSRLDLIYLSKHSLDVDMEV